MTTPHRTLQMALDALDAITDDVDGTGLNTMPSFDKAIDAIAALREALAQPEPIDGFGGNLDEAFEPAPPAAPAPADMVMVPKEPTHEMLYAMAELDGWRKGDRDHPMFTRWRDYWNAALAAAPAPAPAVCCRNELLTALHTLASNYENALGMFGQDGEGRRKAEGDLAHAMKVAAKHNRNGPGCAAPAPAVPDDAALNTLARLFHNGEEIEGDDGAAMMVDLSLWHEASEAFDSLIGDGDGETLASSAAPAVREPLTDARKLCTCDGAGRGPGRACVVQAGGRLGDLWKCAKSAAPAVREPLTREQQIAIREAQCNTASDEYFGARPHIDSREDRRIYEAGFKEGWESGIGGGGNG